MEQCIHRLCVGRSGILGHRFLVSEIDATSLVCIVITSSLLDNVTLDTKIILRIVYCVVLCVFYVLGDSLIRQAGINYSTKIKSYVVIRYAHAINKTEGQCLQMNSGRMTLMSGSDLTKPLSGVWIIDVSGNCSSSTVIRASKLSLLSRANPPCHR